MAIFNGRLTEWEESLIRMLLVKILYLVITLAKYFFLKHFLRNKYSAFIITLKYERIARTVSGWWPSQTIRKINLSLIKLIRNPVTGNMLVDWYVESREAQRYREEFQGYGLQYQIRLKYPRSNDLSFRQGDLLLLKPKISDKERGVLLIQYNDSFKKFVSLFDIQRVAKSYRLVLEPSTWGYCDLSILLFLGLDTDIVVQAQNELDFDYIQSLKSNLIPLRIGAGDWVDPDKFNPKACNQKDYDLVMVASWQRIKRHKKLFEILQKCGNSVGKIALIGYPSEGRNKGDVIKEAERYGLVKKIVFYESIPREQVVEILCRSKIGVMLTIREGANKGIYECFFCGVPVIISNKNIGVNRDHINQYTGMVIEDQDLVEAIPDLIKNVGKYDPRKWALEHSGYRFANNALNECLKQLAISNNENWTRDIFIKKNDTNSQYVFDSERIEADKSIQELIKMLRI